MPGARLGRVAVAKVVWVVRSSNLTEKAGAWLVPWLAQAIRMEIKSSLSGFAEEVRMLPSKTTRSARGVGVAKAVMTRAKSCVDPLR